MEKWFKKQSRLVQVLLLLIPGVNWIVEILVRWDAAMRKKSTIRLVVAVIVTFFGLVFGYFDVIWCLLFKHLILA